MPLELIMPHEGAHDKEKLTGRDGRVWHMYAVLSMTQEAIARELGISQPRVSKIIRDTRAKLPQQTREEIAQERAEQLRAVVNAIAPGALSGDPDLIRSMLALQQREAKLLGLDNPVKAEIDATVRYEVIGLGDDDAGDDRSV